MRLWGHKSRKIFKFVTCRVFILEIKNINIIIICIYKLCIIFYNSFKKTADFK